MLLLRAPMLLSPQDRNRLIGLGFATVLILIAAARCDRSRENTPIESDGAATPASTRAPDWRLIAYGQDEVRKLLRDPGAAEFGRTYVSRRAGVAAICGTVNSRNGFGGMAGPQRFTSGSMTALEEQMQAGAMDEVWNKVC